MNTIPDELERRAELREEEEKREGGERRGWREERMERGEDGERRADKTKSQYSHRWGESLHVVTVTFV